MQVATKPNLASQRRDSARQAAEKPDQVNKKQAAKPNLNQYLKDRTGVEQDFIKIANSVFVKKLLEGINIATFLTNLSSSALSVLPVNKELKDLAYKVSEAVTKATLGIISGVSGAKRLIGQRNLLLGLGQLADPTINTWAWNFVDLFLGRGFSYATTIIGIGLNVASGKENFKSFTEAVQSWGPGIKQLWQDAKNGFLKNYFNAKSGLMSFTNGIIMAAGAALGFMSPQKSLARKFGATVRTFAGMMQDIERCRTRAKPLYFKSGLCHLAESILNLVPKYFPENQTIKMFFTSLGMGLGNLGRFLFAEAQDQGEITKMEGETLVDEVYNWWLKNQNKSKKPVNTELSVPEKT